MEKSENEGFELCFSEVKIKEAVWSYDGSKIPGPVGYILDFFKKNWEVVKEDVLRFVGDFHSKAILTKVCTSSFIALIPKVVNPQSLTEFIPICLLGNLYKLISKLLAAKIKRIIGKLIPVKQSASKIRIS